MQVNTSTLHGIILRTSPPSSRFSRYCRKTLCKLVSFAQFGKDSPPQLLSRQNTRTLLFCRVNPQQNWILINQSLRMHCKHELTPMSWRKSPDFRPFFHHTASLKRGRRILVAVVSTRRWTTTECGRNVLYHPLLVNRWVTRLGGCWCNSDTCAILRHNWITWTLTIQTKSNGILLGNSEVSFSHTIYFRKISERMGHWSLVNTGLNVTLHWLEEKNGK